MKLCAVLCVAACGGSAKQPTAPVAPVASVAPVVPADTACRAAYGEYEATWRQARTEELAEFAANDEAVIEEILFYELATLPSRAEVTKLREIYAVVEAFLWDAPWPRALAASDTAIEHCGERTPRPG